MTTLASPDDFGPDRHDPTFRTSESGHPGGHAVEWHHKLGHGYKAHSYEENPDLEFPLSIAVFDRMRKQEAQIAALLRAINLPILGARWSLATEAVRPAVARFVETELGLTRQEKGHGRRRRQGIVWTEHLRHALLALPLGFMPFEQVYAPGGPTAEQQDVEGMPEVLIHLRKLGPRLPRTVQEIRVDRDGGLAGIMQVGVGWDATGQGHNVQVIGGRGQDTDAEIWIPASQLVMYCYDREGADWTGNGILRSAYKNYLLKTELERIDAMSGERNGMGIPLVYYTSEGSEGEALKIAQGIRSGSTAGGAIPDGKYRVEIEGVKGTIKDLLPSIKHHEQAMSRAALAMFLDLGHDNGARSLGETFVDLFTASLNAVTGWVCEVATEAIIRDLVELNFGPDEPYPVLTCDPISSEATPTAEALKVLVEARLIEPDEPLRQEVRRRYGLPPAAEPDPATPEDPEELVIVPGDDESPESLDPHAMEPGTDPAVQDPVAARAVDLAERIVRLRGLTRVTHDGPVTHTPYGAIPRDRFTGDPDLDQLHDARTHVRDV